MNTEEIVRRAVAEEGNAIGGWIFGAVLGLIFGSWGLMGAHGPVQMVLFGSIGAAIGIVPSWLAVKWFNKTSATRVRAIVTEGRRFEGRVVQAMRRSMTQSRVIVQGEGFAGLERLVTTNVPDAQLLNSVVDVYVHPQHGAHFVLR